jgi:hypothetical protein
MSNELVDTWFDVFTVISMNEPMLNELVCIHLYELSYFDPWWVQDHPEKSFKG